MDLRPDAAALQAELASARDAKIGRVVAMVDALPNRGAADHLIAPLRPRLAELRPPRPMNFGRILFYPVDPLIQPATAWRRDTLGVPRTALRPLAELVQASMPEAAREATALLAGRTMHDQTVVSQVGGLLWEAAGRVLAQAQAPADWAAATGLSQADYRILSHALALLLGSAHALYRIEIGVRHGVEPDIATLENLLAPAVAAGGDPLGMQIALLLAKLPQCAAMTALANRLAAPQGEAPLRAAADRALTFVLDSMATAPPLSADLDQALIDVRRMAGLLDEIEGRSGQRPAQLARVAEIRRQVDASCRQRFEASLRTQMLEPLRGLSGADTASVMALERAARDLRRFEQTARQLGSPQHYDRLLRATSEALRPAPGESRATRIDRIRLVEILLGSDEALAMLEAS